MAETQSTVIRDRIARENEDLVLAENALLSEQMVAWIRLATLLLLVKVPLSLSQLGGIQYIRDPARLTVGGLYIAFTLAVIIRLRQVRPHPLKTLRSEFLFAVVDFGFMTFMSYRSWQLEHLVSPQRAAIVNALLMCYALGRMGWVHVVFSCTLAILSYLLLVSHGVLLGNSAEEIFSNSSVIGGYVALALLLIHMQERIRNMFVTLRKRDNLMSFLPRQVAERVMRLGDSALAPVQREVTVLFSDIRDFTAFSEALPPGDVLAFLDEYFGHMAQLVKAHDGIVNKFIGDGMLAFWGVPERTSDHAELALKAALDMRKVVGELNAVRRQNGEEPIRIGIGIHTGVVAAGMLGGADQHEYTVIGDAVNVASRVEGLTKELGIDILVSESTWRLAGHRFKGQRISEQRVKGRQEAVVVYSLEDRLPKAAEASAA